MQKRASTAAKVAIWAIFLIWVGLSAGANYAHGKTAAASLLMAAAPVGFAAVMGVFEYAISRGLRLGWAGYLTVVLVAGAAGVTSYIGLFGFAVEQGIGRLPAALLPAGFDGVVLAMSLVLRGLSHGPVIADTAPVTVTVVRHVIHQWPAPVMTTLPYGPVTAVNDIDLDSILSRHGLPDDSELALAMEMLEDMANDADTAPDDNPVPVSPAGPVALKPWAADAYGAIQVASREGRKLAEVYDSLGQGYNVGHRTVRRQVAAYGAFLESQGAS